MTLSDLVTWIIVGGVAGWLSQRVVEGFKSGVIGTIFIGVLGAVVGSYLVRETGIIIDLGNDLATSIAIAFLGSVVLLVVMRMLH